MNNDSYACHRIEGEWDIVHRVRQRSSSPLHTVVLDTATVYVKDSSLLTSRFYKLYIIVISWNEVQHGKQSLRPMQFVTRWQIRYRSTYSSNVGISP